MQQVFLVNSASVLIGNFSDGIKHPISGSSITSASSVGGLALALYSVLWAYEGW